MNPFQNILWLTIGDFLAKTLNFFVFVYLARVLGVAHYGILEMAISVMTYFLLLADGGLELWGTREAAQGKDPRPLAARIVPLRLLLAAGAFGVLLILLPLFPDYPFLKAILVLFGLGLFAQGTNLKWVFMGQEKMAGVAQGLLVAQLVFAATVFALVHSRQALIWVPLLKLSGDVAMSVYFARRFTAAFGSLRLTLTRRGELGPLRPALTMGASHGLALLNYNFDTILLGFLVGPTAVGWYNAAYKPVTAVLAVPTTYFLGLFPVLSRAYAERPEQFRNIVLRSLWLASVCGIPVGIAGFFLAEPVISLLFGPAYASAVPVLQILAWSATLVILRGTFRQALNAAGHARLDLLCATASTGLNIGLNVLLIPWYGIIGAAMATVVSEVLWVILAVRCFSRHVASVEFFSVLLRPVLASSASFVCLWVTQPWAWAIRAPMGVLTYAAMLLLLRPKDLGALTPLSSK